MRRLSLRVRLTVLVTGAFVLALAAAGLVARQQLESTLIDTARNTAEQTLQDSFFSEPTPEGVTVIDGVTRFIFTDEAGTELDERAFAQLVDQAMAAELAELGVFLDQGPAVFAPEEPGSAMVMVEAFSVSQPIEPFGNIEYRDTADEIIVSQPARIGDDEIAISVSTPRQPLDESLDAFTTFGLIMLPILGALVALATWITSSRVLRPVEAIRQQVSRTTSDRLDHHVPRSGRGDEIDRLAGTMNDMLDRLQEASGKQRQFVSDASHELRSPITATLATLETTDASEAGQHWDEIRITLVNEQTRLARLVDDLLLLATVDEGAHSPGSDEVDLDELVLTESQRPHPVTIETRIIDAHRVEGSTRLLQRCLANLVENAARHAKTTVTVTLDTADNGAPVIGVEDDGPGIPADRLDSIFERFARLDGARNRREGGAGLGLAIAREIASTHNAELVALNRSTGGARFELRFPPSLDLSPEGPPSVLQ